MEMQEFLDQLEQTIFRYDLLQHPFYQAWSRGELALEDLREYARDYYHQVESFPGYLLRFAARLERGDPRAAVLANLRDEVGGSTRRSHSDLWLDFVEGMGAERPLAGHKPSSQIFDLVLFFEQMAKQGSREEVLAAFYAYESQVPRVSWEKWRGLAEKYGRKRAHLWLFRPPYHCRCLRLPGLAPPSSKNISGLIQKEATRRSRPPKPRLALFGEHSMGSKFDPSGDSSGSPLPLHSPEAMSCPDD